MDRRTFLYERHVSAGARMVSFAGWSMPLHYGSQIEEHHAVRRRAGIFDVSHMQIVDLDGAGAVAFLRHLLANDVAKLRAEGRALYTCMLNERGGVIDDLIVYRMPDGRYRLVVNAATAEKDIGWMADRATPFGVSLAPRRDLAMLAVQGPGARELAAHLLPAGLAASLPGLAAFSAATAGDWLAARTGYTGEDGIELMLPGEAAPALWDALLGAGVQPCGLGARDTLRLEAGLPLYGQDMDESATRPTATSSGAPRWKPSGAAPSCPASPVSCCRTAASCGPIRRCLPGNWKSVKLPRADMPRPSTAPSPWRGCGGRRVATARWRSAAGGWRWRW